MDWEMLCYYDCDLPAEPSYKSLPGTMRSAPGGIQQIVMRTGWDFDDTQIMINPAR
jgi:hypothetical protein